MLEKVMELHFLLYAMMLMGGLGALGMLTTHLTYRRMIRKNTEVKSNLQEKWTNLWKTRDRLLNRMNRFVWYPSLFCIAFLGLAFFLYSKDVRWDGMPLAYLYVAAIIPTALLLLRQALDFTYREELLMNSFSDYVEHARTWVEEVPVPEKADEAVKEEIVEHIADSIRQTAAAGSHFSGMLTPEEDEIMREIIWQCKVSDPVHILRQNNLLFVILFNYLDLQIIKINLLYKIILIKSGFSMFLKMSDCRFQPDWVSQIHFITDTFQTTKNLVGPRIFGVIADYSIFQ